MRPLIVSLAILAGLSAAEARPLEVVGTGDGMELVRAIGAAFTAENPDSVILVPPSIGSGGGIAAVGAGKALLARVARPLKAAEANSGLKARAMFRLPTAIYVNRGVDVDGLSYTDLAGIFEGRIVNWKDVGGPDLRIKVVRRELTDSSFTVLQKSMPGWDSIKVTPRSHGAVTTQDAVETVKKVRGAIGFGPFSRELESSAKILSIAGQYPTDPNYPTAVTVSYVWRTADYPAGVKQFVEFGRSKRVKALLSALGAVPSEDRP